MSIIDEFKCISNDFEKIPESIITEKNIKFPEVHTNYSDLVKLSSAIKEHKKDYLCRLPFCNTVEAEALGAEITLGDEKVGPRVKNYNFMNIEEMLNLGEIDFNNGRINEVLNAVEELSHSREIVSLNVEGAFTIIASLIDSMIFYKAVRKNREIVDNILEVVEDNIVNCALQGIKRGAKIISFADPVGTLDIVGPKIFKDISGPSECRVINRIIEQAKKEEYNFIIHICGKASVGLEKQGFITSEDMKFSDDIKYGEALIDILNNLNGVKIIGHNCIKRTMLKMKDSTVWSISFN